MRWRAAPGLGTGTAEATPCVGMPGRGEDAPFRGQLDDLAEIHDRHPMCHVLDDRKIVADEQQRKTKLLLQGWSRLTICAFTETSSAETGSSHTIRAGSAASARAIPMRWRSPPENSCGQRFAASRGNRTLSMSASMRASMSAFDAASPASQNWLGNNVAHAHAGIEAGEWS